jgi:hypothetical protein
MQVLAGWRGLAASDSAMNRRFQLTWRMPARRPGARRARLLEQYTQARLEAMRDHLLAAATLIDAHRARLAHHAGESTAN